MKKFISDNKFGVIALFGLLLAVQVAINSHAISHSILTIQDDCVICHISHDAPIGANDIALQLDTRGVANVIKPTPKVYIKHSRLLLPQLRAPPISYSL